MQAFTYRSGQLCAEDVAVQDLARQYGTPLYVYSRGHLREQYRALAAAMAEVAPLICYSVKANSNAAVIRTLVDEGAGLDIVSGGELYRALHAGADAANIVFAGVGKTREEIEYALREQILFFTVESEPEVQRISDCARHLGLTGRVAFRVNPDVDPQTHKYISTGKKENKFGLDPARAVRAYALAAALPNIEIAGLHMHIGSQILTAQPYGAALAKVRDLCLELKRAHRTFRYLDIGGGLGIEYKPDQPPLDFAVFAAAVLPHIRELGLRVVMEPGRCLVGNAGLLVCRVQYVKESYKKFIVVDAAMNDLIRPPLYQAYHEVVAVQTGDAPPRVYDVVGPVCESSDVLAQGRSLRAREGDLLAILSAGAYAFVMASNYNSRPRAPEVMIAGATMREVRARETFDTLVAGESL